MSYIKIKKDKLVNLEYTLNREVLRSNRAGSYASTTLNGCNTRKYHGLLVSPLTDGNKHVLLSAVDDTIIQRGKEFRLGIHQYQEDIFFPHGHRYMVDFEIEPIPTRIYNVGGVVLKKELLLAQEEETILIRYTIEDAHSPTVLRLSPLLGFRNIHKLSKENMDVNNKSIEVTNGIKVKMYDNYPYLFMQTSKKGKFIPAPDWNKDILYKEEQNRGYDYLEDLYTYGYFEIDVKKGDTVIFSAGLKQANTRGLKSKFDSEVDIRIPRDSFENNLINSAQQFLIKYKKETNIIAGFHWYTSELRESLLSLTGLTLNGDTEKFIHAFDSILSKFFKTEPANITPDIPLLIFRAFQDYVAYAENCEEPWNKYRTRVLKIVRNLFAGNYNAEIHENGLLYIPENDITRTWMNEHSEGKPVSPRTGFVVEINALWYNTLMHLSGVADMTNSSALKKELGNLPEKAGHFFNVTFINTEDDTIYDFVNSNEQNRDIRPNQIFAVSLPYSPLSDMMKKNVLSIVESHLLTKKGLRSLSPKNIQYKGKYHGNVDLRNAARHQGTVHPWLIFEYCSAWLNLYKDQGLDYVKNIYEQFEREISRHGLGSISELYDGNPPHKANGAISYAPSVAALIRLKKLIDNFIKS